MQQTVEAAKQRTETGGSMGVGRIPFLSWVFQVIPEGVAMATLALALGTGRIAWKKNLLVGFIFACFVYVVRLLPLIPGTHVIVLAAVLGALCVWPGGLELRKGFSFGAITAACLVLLEFAFTSVYIKSGLFTMDEILGNNLYRIIVGNTHNAALFLLAYLVKKKGIDLNFLFRPKGRGFNW